MYHAQDNHSGYMLLAVVILVGALAASTSWHVAQKSENGKPSRIITLSQSVGQCRTRGFQSGLKFVGCTEDTRGVRRGSNFFMKPPAP